jgi:hypothetical protein
MSRTMRRAARQPRGFDAMVKGALADGAARDLMQTIAQAQAQQAGLEKDGLDPRNVNGGCVSESGEPLKVLIAGVDAENRVIVVTRKVQFGPAVWFYATRAEGLMLMLRPALAAFDHATAAHGRSTALIRAAEAALDRAIQHARACDAVKGGTA